MGTIKQTATAGTVAKHDARSELFAAVRGVIDLLERMPLEHASADELRPIAALAEEWGLEARGLAKAIARAAVPVVKIGRAKCVRVSDVVGRLVDALGEKAEGKTKNDGAEPSAYEKLIAQTRDGRRAA